jgi:hypothetical protein
MIAAIIRGLKAAARFQQRQVRAECRLPSGGCILIEPAQTFVTRPAEETKRACFRIGIAVATPSQDARVNIKSLYHLVHTSCAPFYPTLHQPAHVSRFPILTKHVPGPIDPQSAHRLLGH